MPSPSRASTATSSPAITSSCSLRSTPTTRRTATPAAAGRSRGPAATADSKPVPGRPNRERRAGPAGRAGQRPRSSTPWPSRATPATWTPATSCMAAPSRDPPTRSTATPAAGASRRTPAATARRWRIRYPAPARCRRPAPEPPTTVGRRDRRRRRRSRRPADTDRVEPADRVERTRRCRGQPTESEPADRARRGPPADDRADRPRRRPDARRPRPVLLRRRPGGVRRPLSGRRPGDAIPQLTATRAPGARPRARGPGASTLSARVHARRPSVIERRRNRVAVDDDLDHRRCRPPPVTTAPPLTVTTVPDVDQLRRPRLPAAPSRRRRWNRPGSAPIPSLDALAQSCYDGDMAACDDLWRDSEPGSDYRNFGDTCAGRQPPNSGTWCDDAFPGRSTTTTAASRTTTPAPTTTPGPTVPGQTDTVGDSRRPPSSPLDSATIRRSTCSPVRASTATCRRATSCSTQAPIGSDYRAYGDTCAGRQEPGTFNYCHVSSPPALAAEVSNLPMCV